MAAGGESGVGGVPWAPLGPETGGVGPLPASDRVLGADIWVRS